MKHHQMVVRQAAKKARQAQLHRFLDCRPFLAFAENAIVHDVVKWKGFSIRERTNAKRAITQERYLGLLLNPKQHRLVNQAGPICVYVKKELLQRVLENASDQLMDIRRLNGLYHHGPQELKATVDTLLRDLTAMDVQEKAV